MSAYLDRLEHRTPQPPAVELTEMLLAHIGTRPGRSNLQHGEARTGVEEGIRRALLVCSAEELEMLLWWAFNRQDDFWRDNLSNADYPGAFLAASLPAMLKQFRADKRFPHHQPELLGDTGYEHRIRSITPPRD